MIDQIEVRSRKDKRLVGVLRGGFDERARFIRVFLPFKFKLGTDCDIVHDIGARDYPLEPLIFSNEHATYFIEVDDDDDAITKAREFVPIDSVAKPKAPERMKHIGYWLAAPKEIGQGPNDERGQFFYEYADALSVAACASFPAPRIAPVFRYA